MIFTRRFFILFALGILPLLLSAVAPGFALLTVLWNLVLFALCLADYLTCPNPATALEVSRDFAPTLSVASTNPVFLHIRNPQARLLRLRLRDEPPPTFALLGEENAQTENPSQVVEPREWALQLAPFESRTFSYSITPPRRGDFAFGNVFARLTGPIGLMIREGAIVADGKVSVYPNLHAVQDYELMLRRAHLTRKGTRRVRIAGGGREFSALRDYTPDDEYRTIDWSATARRGKVISRTFEAERSQDILLIIDQGRLMRQEIGDAQKLDHVVSAGLMLSHVVAEADDRIGLLTFADATRAWLPPRRGRAQANDILKSLYAARAEPVESDYRSAFRFLSSHWRKRSLAVLFTDLSDPESSAMLLNEIAQLAAMHLVICVVVSDPLIGQRAAQNSETLGAVYEKAVAQEVIVDRQRALDLLRRRGVLVVDAEPQQLSIDLVARYLEVKNRAML